MRALQLAPPLSSAYPGWQSFGALLSLASTVPFLSSLGVSQFSKESCHREMDSGASLSIGCYCYGGGVEGSELVLLSLRSSLFSRMLALTPSPTPTPAPLLFCSPHSSLPVPSVPTPPPLLSLQFQHLPSALEGFNGRWTFLYAGLPLPSWG